MVVTMVLSSNVSAHEKLSFFISFGELINKLIMNYKTTISVYAEPDFTK